MANSNPDHMTADQIYFFQYEKLKSFLILEY